MACLRPLVLLCVVFSAVFNVGAQTPLVITLHDALARARQYGTQIQSANLNARWRRKTGCRRRRPRCRPLNAFNQFIYTEGNGTPSGVFVANDGVHVYNEQAQVHEELLAFVRHGEIRRAMAAEAVAQGEGRSGAARAERDGGAGLLRDPRGAAQARERANQPA